MASPTADDQERVAASKERRRRERWNAFLTPFITLTSIVIAVGVMMSMIKACQDRFPNNPFNKPGTGQPTSLTPVIR